MLRVKGCDPKVEYMVSKHFHDYFFKIINKLTV